MSRKGSGDGLRRWGWHPIDSFALTGVLVALSATPMELMPPRFPLGLCLTACVLRWVWVFLSIKA